MYKGDILQVYLWSLWCFYRHIFHFWCTTSVHPKSLWNVQNIIEVPSFLKAKTAAQSIRAIYLYLHMYLYTVHLCTTYIICCTYNPSFLYPTYFTHVIFLLSSIYQNTLISKILLLQPLKFLLSFRGCKL